MIDDRMCRRFPPIFLAADLAMIVILSLPIVPVGREPLVGDDKDDDGVNPRPIYKHFAVQF